MITGRKPIITAQIPQRGPHPHAAPAIRAWCGNGAGMQSGDSRFCSFHRRRKKSNGFRANARRRRRKKPKQKKNPASTKTPKQHEKNTQQKSYALTREIKQTSRVKKIPDSHSTPRGIKTKKSRSLRGIVREWCGAARGFLLFFCSSALSQANEYFFRA